MSLYILKIKRNDKSTGSDIKDQIVENLDLSLNESYPMIRVILHGSMRHGLREADLARAALRLAARQDTVRTGERGTRIAWNS